MKTLIVLCIAVLYFWLWNYVVTFVRAAGNITVDSTCGESRGCYHDCATSGCDFLITWVYRDYEDTVEFTMSKTITDPYNPQWVAFGLSEDDRMGYDSVVECVTDGHLRVFADVRQSYNQYYYNVDILDPKYGMREMYGQMEDGRLTCTFRRHVHVNVHEIFDLDRPWYLLVASGYMQHGSKLRHKLFPDLPVVSPYQIDFREHNDVYGKTVKHLIKIHGSLMIVAWVILASFAIPLARFYKQQWPNGRACDRRIWYQVHKVLMLCVSVCVTVAFVLIFVHTQGYSEMRGSNSIQRAHPVLGIVVMALTVLNPIMGFLRPQSGVASRALFKYMHSFIGTVLYVLAVLNIIIGVTLHKSSAPASAMWVLVAFAGYQLAVQIVLEIHECFLIKTGRQSDYEMKELSAIRRDSIADTNIDPPGSLFKNIFIACHIAVVFGFGIASIILLVV